MPDSPEPLAPDEGTDIDEPSVTFRWTEVGDADNYELQLARSRDFDDFVFRGRVGDVTEFSYSGLPAQEGISLFWRVRARGEDGGWSDYSPTASFVLADWQPEQPALTPAQAGEEGEAAPVTEASESSTAPFLLISFVVVSVALTGALFAYVDNSTRNAASTTATTPPPDTATSDIRRYDVVDEEQGVYQIPIDSAMKDVVESRGGRWEE